MRVPFGLILVSAAVVGCSGNSNISYTAVGSTAGSGSSGTTVATNGTTGSHSNTLATVTGSTGGQGATTSSTTTTGGNGSGSTNGTLCQSQLCEVYASSDTDLYQVNPADAGAPPVHLCAFGGALSSSDTVTDIAVIAQGTLYAITEKALYTVDATNCAATMVASLSTSSTSYVCLGFTYNGVLVASDEDGNVYTIDTTSGAVTTVGTFGGGLACSGDIMAVSAGTELTAPIIFATAAPKSGSYTTDQLVSLDPTTYAATVIGPIGYKAVYGLAYWGGQLIGFTHAGQTLLINPSTGAGTVLYTTNPVASYSGGATTPLAPQTPMWE